MEDILREVLQEVKLLRATGRKILTTEAAAEYLDIKVSYLHKLTANRTIPHRKPNGGKLYFLKSELDEWVTNAVVPTEEQILNNVNK